MFGFEPKNLRKNKLGIEQIMLMRCIKRSQNQAKQKILNK